MCPCIFIYKLIFGFIIIVVDDINIVGTLEEIPNAVGFLKKDFMIKIFEK